METFSSSANNDDFCASVRRDPCRTEHGIVATLSARRICSSSPVSMVFLTCCTTRLPSEENPSAFLTWWIKAVSVLRMMLNVGSAISALRWYKTSGAMIEAVDVCSVCETD